MASVSFEDFAGAGTGSKPTPSSSGKGQRATPAPASQSFEEFAGVERSPQTAIQKGINFIKGAGAEGAALADLVMSLPGQAIGVGANLGAQAYAVGSGESPKIQAQAGREATDWASGQFSNPLQKALSLFNSGEIYNQAKTTQGMAKVSEWIGEAGDWVEKHTNGKIPSEQVATLFDVITLGLGTKGASIAHESWKAQQARAKLRPPKEPTPAQVVEQGPQRTAQQQINEGLRIKTKAERDSWDKRRRSEVRAAFREDPEYADYLGYLAEERVTRHDNWMAAEAAQAAREDSITPVIERIREQAKTGQEGRARIKQQRLADELEGPVPSMEEAMQIMQKPLEERTGQELLSIRRWNQKGEVDPALLARMAAAGVGIAAGAWLDPNDPIQGALIGGGVMLAPAVLMKGDIGAQRFRQAGAVKAPGGMWHPEAVERLAKPLERAMATAPLGEGRAAALAAHPATTWATKAIRNYLNKYAGTERDPLKDVEIPHTYGNAGEGVMRWEDAWDRAIGQAEARALTPDSTAGWRTFEGSDKIPPTEKISQFGNYVGGAGDTAASIKSYLSHVGDYLRQNVDPAKLPQYDLVRAVRETAANDARVEKEMEKAAAASTKDLPVYKDYGDGFKWVELKLPEKLTEEQAKQVKKTPGTKDQQGYLAIGADDKPIKNAYTEEEAYGRTPEEAWLAGRLAEEGNQMGHCVGGYCEPVASGESRIFSLRDAKGKSHVTVEVEPAQAYAKEGKPVSEKEGPDNILQIKGKQNRAPTKEYLPYVQDFVRSGKWGEVGDLENTGLIDSRSISVDDMRVETEPHPRQRHLTDLEKEAAIRDLQKQRFLTREEFDEFLNKHRFPKGQRGSADIKTVGRIAALAGGATLGAVAADDKETGALLGALAGLALTTVSPKGVADLYRRAFKPDTRIRINNLANAHEYQIAAAARAVWQFQTKIEKAVKDVKRREAVTHWLEGDESVKLAPAEQAVAREVRQYFDQLREVGQEAGVLKDAVDNYVTHLWSRAGQSKDALQALFERRAGGPGMSPETRFALRRTIPTIKEGKRLGLTPVTEDVSAIIGVYGNAVQRALANKQLIGQLKQAKAPSGEGLVLPSPKAPGSYVHIDHPQLAGQRVHPDIAPSMRFLFEQREPGVIMRGLEGLNTALKRVAVSFSLFHAKALVDAFVGAASNPLVVGKQIAQAAAPSLFGENIYLRQLREGGAGDMVDMAQKAGLKFSVERAAPAVEDVSGTFYTMLKDLQGGLDNLLPGTGLSKVIGGFTKINHGVDRFMWDRLHAGMKLSIFAEKYEKLLQNNAAAHAKNPMVPLRAKEDLAAMAADFTNSIFGGLNWRRVAESASTRWGREAALAAYSPVGRRIMQVLLFAPDWTISTTRAAVQAFGRGTGFKGLIKPETLADLHRQYLVRSAIYYLAVGDAMNYAFSGHHLWQNQDWTTIDMGDGRKMQWSKHTMEPIHWLTKPGQQALNKLGFVPREIAEQLLDQEYLTTTGHAPKIKNRFTHLARNVTPISVGQSFEAGHGSGIAGFLGAPIYGKTDEQRQREKEKRRLRRILGEK